MSVKTARSFVSELLQDSIPRNIRRKGEAYYRWGSVRRLKGDAFSVEAEVQGTQLYHVTLKYLPEERQVNGHCTCPFFAGNQACKHLWAVLLAADKEGLLSAVVADEERLLADADKADDWVDPDEYNPGAIDFRSARTVLPTRQASTRRANGSPSWKEQLDFFQRQLKTRQLEGAGRREIWPTNRQVVYMIDAAETLRGQGLALELGIQDRKKDGGWGKLRSPSIRHADIDHLPDGGDRRILAGLAGSVDASYSWGYSYGYVDLQRSIPSRFFLSTQLSLELVPLLCATGRCWLQREGKDHDPLSRISWDEGPAWDFGVDVAPDPDGIHYILTGALRRGDVTLPISTPMLLTSAGLVFTGETAARLAHHDAFEWVLYLRQHGPIRIPRKDKDAWLERMMSFPVQAPLRLPPELSIEDVRTTPKPRLKLHRAKQLYAQPRLPAHWEFEYDGVTVHAHDPRTGIYQPEKRRLLLRDRAAEEKAAARLVDLGFKTPSAYERSDQHMLELVSKRLPHVVMQLLAEGWHVEAEGKLYRRPGEVKVDVTSGIDWFELHGDVSFDGQTVGLPQLLQALRRGEGMIQLSDGTFGLVAEDWLKKYASLASLGETHDDHLRFRPAQVGFLDALLATMPEVRCDEVFVQARDRLRKFDGIQPADPPPRFTGELRPYQRDGLGWFHFLRDFRFGGCLADDMGLGKTVQVLAWLEARRQEKTGGTEAVTGEPLSNHAPRPSLVVVPRSLVFNWKQEAARFTPDLQILDHTGAERVRRGGNGSLEHFADYDLVLTTYGTLRRDAAKFKDVLFDYAILDEAQAVKNPVTASAKAVRLLQAKHRLVLTGTPVENRLGDLWSLFEFLNPGMLGSASVFNVIGAGSRNADPETRGVLGRALRPFILRRTKEQVARDLPQKLEQTLHCEFDAPQQKLYNELRDHYRRTLLDKATREGINRIKIQVLEALLRLRQAACHPGLIDPARRHDDSAKLDALLPQLEEVCAEGHKALVFSQFTSFLAIVRDRLDRAGVCYEYLDGHTQDRGARVERFQNDPDCRLFLISLKAGGLGLNLTAAEYVFLLDPWWNPAVEAQAIDRAHRIGQERPVFAYRLIVKNTVEEKVLELQNTKRDLADAIVNADNSVIRNLGREDLELLLS
jgi:hypothetical protein